MSEKLTRIDTEIRTSLQSPNQLAEFDKLLKGSDIDPDKFVRYAITALSKNPDLAKCDKASVFLSLMKLAELQLPPDGWHAHLIPYGNTCTPSIDYKGYVALLLRNKVAAYIDAHIVAANDLFEITFGTNRRLNHTPAIYVDRGEPIGAYVCAKLCSGELSFHFMNAEEIELRRKASKNPEKIWVKWKFEMWRKTVVRNWVKYQLLTPQVRTLIELDDSENDSENLQAPNPNPRPRLSPPKPGPETIPAAEPQSESELTLTQEKAP